MSTEFLPAVRLRRLERLDAPRLLRLVVELGYSLSGQELADRLGDLCGHPEHLLLGAEEAGQLVGFAHAARIAGFFEQDKVELLGLVVTGSVRSQGTGTRLLEAVEDWALDQGCTGLQVHSSTPRLRAHEFYRKSGYREVKTQKVFFKEFSDLD